MSCFLFLALFSIWTIRVQGLFFVICKHDIFAQLPFLCLGILDRSEWTYCSILLPNQLFWWFDPCPDISHIGLYHTDFKRRYHDNEDMLFVFRPLLPIIYPSRNLSTIEKLWFLVMGLSWHLHSSSCIRLDRWVFIDRLDHKDIFFKHCTKLNMLRIRAKFTDVYLTESFSRLRVSVGMVFFWHGSKSLSDLLLSSANGYFWK